MQKVTLTINQATGNVTFPIIAYPRLAQPSGDALASDVYSFGEIAEANQYELEAVNISTGERTAIGTSYPIYATVVNCTADSGNVNLTSGGSTTLIFTAASGKAFTSSAISSLVGATQVSWTLSTTSTTNDTGTLVITPTATGAVSFTVTGTTATVTLDTPVDIAVNNFSLASIEGDLRTQQYIVTIDDSELGTLNITRDTTPVVVSADQNLVTTTTKNVTSQIDVYIDGNLLGTVNIQ